MLRCWFSYVDTLLIVRCWLPYVYVNTLLMLRCGLSHVYVNRFLAALMRRQNSLGRNMTYAKKNLINVAATLHRKHRKPGLQQILASIRLCRKECAAGLSCAPSEAPERWWKSVLHVLVFSRFGRRRDIRFARNYIYIAICITIQLYVSLYNHLYYITSGVYPWLHLQLFQEKKPPENSRIPRAKFLVMLRDPVKWLASRCQNRGTGSTTKKHRKIWGVPYMVLPKNGWFRIGNPIFRWMMK